MAFIKLDRRFFTGKYWTQERTYSYAEAWLDLIQMARVDADPQTKILSNGRQLEIKRGEIHASLRFLAERWKWSPNKVKEFLRKCKENNDIAQRTAHNETIISLVNYDTYNRMKSKDCTLTDTLTYTPPAHRQHSGSTNIKNEKNVKNGENVSTRARETPTHDFHSDSEEVPDANATDTPDGDKPMSPIDELVWYWNLKAEQPGRKVQMIPIKWLIAPPIVASRLLHRIEEYGDEKIMWAIDRIEDADWWHGKTLGVETFLDDTKFPKFLNGEYKRYTDKNKR